MGEVAVSSGGGMELEVVGEAAAAAAADTSSTVRWERFLPKMAVRVLLVEADDSTRQIITALLRKCSYRVAAVSDGLKAWELLKGRPHNIDLILTEVELPSISGYALLTLIMEHQVCKNIPVIMMSSNDSVSTVYKCMLRGATDFLVKPVRKNELRNLWQHVWRKQASNTAAGPGPPEESVPQQKDEATAENNAISNQSSGYMSQIPRERECIEKGSDDQSSCTKPEMETEGDDNENTCRKSSGYLSDDVKILTREECNIKSRKRRGDDNETRELLTDYAITREDNGLGQVNGNGRNFENDHDLENSSREAIDLIGAFDNHLKGNFGSSASNFTTNKFDNLPLLDLTLRRSHPFDKRPKLNHSDVSAFSRYIHKPSELYLSSSICNKQKDNETNSEKHVSNINPDCNSDTRDPAIIITQKNVSMPTIQTGQPEITLSHSQNREISHPIPVRGVRYDEDSNNAAGSLMPSSRRAQSSTPHHSESSPQLNVGNSIDQTDDKQLKKLENISDREQVSPGNDQSGNSSYCNNNTSYHQNSVSEGNGNEISRSVIKSTPSEFCNEESYHGHDGASHRAMLREAALTKFRMKRKDRCFEKKVRYESRKKLAEQRPRVKGQFVRQMPNEFQTGNSLAS
ncbi:hypothetical protein ABFS82_06G015200 [Erythranthe guttata]|uniref:two-component response regulator-like APRR5 n=1 Tax=Erythranthe guttata TaxID=4155 RepID=UPI00064DDC22|nr:PREDICTED: two-component response regulator-like APRR5 [Erythranthe guttata]|eukprot:XP_012843465.1 PREDICTED: two-component response regulator-like APRR5 [Erythranthe guttata]